jgi:predicted RNA binding protein YcfA (HicA-like mRNA interferase family)
MAPTLPNISGDQAVKAFQRLGWEVARQRGSHVIMVKAGERASLSVLRHNPVAKGTLRSLIRSAGPTMDEFTAATR